MQDPMMFKLGDRVRITGWQDTHGWSANLVGQRGNVEDVQGLPNGIIGLKVKVVLDTGERVWYAADKLELVEEEAS